MTTVSPRGCRTIVRPPGRLPPAPGDRAAVVFGSYLLLFDLPLSTVRDTLTPFCTAPGSLLLWGDGGWRETYLPPPRTDVRSRRYSSQRQPTRYLILESPKAKVAWTSERFQRGIGIVAADRRWCR